MINQEKIDRINALARKAKESTLDEAEKAEQAQLRREYVDAVKANLSASLDAMGCQPGCDCGGHHGH